MASGGALVGRGEEVRVLERSLAVRPREPARVVAVSGEPGIGKTRLLGELAARAERAGHLVLAGRASEYERELPFAALIDALDDYLASPHARRLERLGDERLAELARVFPSLSDLRTEGSAAERYRFHRAVRALIELLASQTPLLVILDDVHWADEATVELLLYLVRHRPRASAVIALAYRPAQVDAELATQLASASAQEVATVVPLQPLTQDELGAMLGGDVRRDRLAALYRQSGGNPFFAEQLARAPTAGGTHAADSVDEHGVPAAVAAAIDSELAALTPAVRLLLEGAAVAGDSFDLGLAAAAAGVESDAAVPLLDELLRRDLVRATDVPTRFRFRHPVVRRAVYASSGPAWRMQAHGRVSDELVRRGTSPLQRAHHVERSAHPGEAAAIDVLQEAAEAAAARAPATAARWLEAALRLVPEGEPERRLDLLSPLGNALFAVGRLEDARERLLEALELVPPEAVRARLDVLYRYLIVDRHFRPMAFEDDARLVAALADVPEDRAHEAARIEATIAYTAAQGGGSDSTLARGERALAAAERAGDPALVGSVVAALAGRDAFLGRWESARAHAVRAAVLIDGLEDWRLAKGEVVPGFQVARLGLAEWWLDSYEQSLRHLDRSLAIARGWGRSVKVGLVLGARGIVLATLGRTTEALEAAAEAIEAERLTGVKAFLVRALYLQGLAALEVGDVAGARGAAEEGLELGSALPPTMFWSGCRAILGIAELEQGAPDRGRELLYEAGGPDFRRYPRVKALWLDALVRACLALGLTDEAREVAGMASAVGRPELPATAAAAARARAAVLLADGAASEAATCALAAADGALGVGALIDAARSRILAARALAAAGDPERARSVAASAYADLAECRAVRWQDEAARELRRLGVRVPRAGRSGDGSGVAALSGRELEVAELVAAGRTNKQIAAALYLSEKTVEKQLRSVFRKLGVSRRAAVAARLAAGVDPEL